jgi:hypothetical protein
MMRNNIDLIRKKLGIVNPSEKDESHQTFFKLRDSFVFHILTWGFYKPRLVQTPHDHLTSQDLLDAQYDRVLLLLIETGALLLEMP